MEAPVKVKVEYQDETSHSCETPWRMWQCLADRVEFERRFGVSFGEYKIELLEGHVHDEWQAFFAWRALARGVPELAQTSFDDFLAKTAEIEIEREDQEDDEPASEVAGDAEDPTDAKPSG